VTSLRASRLLSYKIILKRQVMVIGDTVLAANFEGQYVAVLQDNIKNAVNIYRGHGADG
jgi:hypothetical protein